jgi:hypothetical protein
MTSPSATVRSVKDDDQYKHHFVGSGSSDDHGSLTGAHLPDGSETTEYEDVSNWFELKLNGEVIGECMMRYNRGWEFRFRSNTHKLEAGALLKSWDGVPYEDWPPEEE